MALFNTSTDSNALISHLILRAREHTRWKYLTVDGRSAKRVFPFRAEGNKFNLFLRSFDLCAVAKRPSANPYTAGAKVALFV